ncbi:hypothetical protein [Pseudorhodoplanes sp.]|uniref:hypothetical protein n=1 Tax=Pseudorhodoplanes sp. TaxID=1934341 RepID=UPI00391A6BF8
MSALPQVIAREVLAALDGATAIAPLSARFPGFDLALRATAMSGIALAGMSIRCT